MAEVRAVTTTAMARVNVALDLHALVGDLPIAQRQLVAICRALAAKARLVIMDEPTASLTRHEVDALTRVVAQLRSEGVARSAVQFKSRRHGERHRLRAGGPPVPRSDPAAGSREISS